MAYESKPGDAVAWPKDKDASEKAPDFKGSFIAHRDIKAGEKISLALWKKDKGRGEFLSGKVEDFRTKPAEMVRGGGASPMDDDIPFGPCK
jgi:hypothetical protein